jgi:hypothetical protein
MKTHSTQKGNFHKEKHRGRNDRGKTELKQELAFVPLMPIKKATGLMTCSFSIFTTLIFFKSGNQLLNLY